MFRTANSQLRSGGEHCHATPAVEEAEGQEDEEEEEEERSKAATSNIKSNNPHLTGGEKQRFPRFYGDSP